MNHGFRTHWLGIIFAGIEWFSNWIVQNLTLKETLVSCIQIDQFTLI